MQKSNTKALWKYKITCKNTDDFFRRTTSSLTNINETNLCNMTHNLSYFTLLYDLLI
jgi:hypothetical protein